MITKELVEQWLKEANERYPYPISQQREIRQCMCELAAAHGAEQREAELLPVEIKPIGYDPRTDSYLYGPGQLAAARLQGAEEAKVQPVARRVPLEDISDTDPDWVDPPIFDHAPAQPVEQPAKSPELRVFVKPVEQPSVDAVEWAVGKWIAEVQNRPLANVHRRSLDDTWRTVIRHFGGDDSKLLPLPRHDDMVMAGGKNSRAPEEDVDYWREKYADLGLNYDKAIQYITQLEATHAQPVEQPLSADQMWVLWNSQGIDEMNQKEAIAFARAVLAAQKAKA